MNILNGIKGIIPRANAPQGMDNIPAITGGMHTGGPARVPIFDIFGVRRWGAPPPK